MGSEGIRGASRWVSNSMSASAGGGEGDGERGSVREKEPQRKRKAGQRQENAGSAWVPRCLSVPSLKPPSHSFLPCTGDPCPGPPSCVPSQPPGSPGRLLSRDPFHSGGSAVAGPMCSPAGEFPQQEDVGSGPPAGCGVAPAYRFHKAQHSDHWLLRTQGQSGGARPEAQDLRVLDRGNRRKKP